jgi:hypothetical protein
LAIEIDTILNNILVNLAGSYPRAVSSGVSLRLKNAIEEINRRDDEENDILLSSNIKISEFLTLTKDRQGN